MSRRRLLVIGSQCKRLNNLSFLPEIAERFHAVMTTPKPGECVVASVGNPPGLLLDPTADQARNAIESAYDEAVTAGDILILVFIGHGELDNNDGDFYLMTTDASVPPTSKSAIHLVQFVKDLYNRPNPGGPGLDGLMILLDTCHAGGGAWQAMEKWARTRKGQIRFELLTATDDRATARARFTEALSRLLERGDPECAGTHPLSGCLPEAQATGSHPATRRYNTDDRLHYLGRNAAKDPGDVFWSKSLGR